ncbi:Acyl-[acyl-carrier-protein]--UDP-N-acetylglucosamine O-acyltransferase [Rosistilla ulvae]|uniref:Acyl-[acyl-carrier-protein]--UDP-N-acetylglucosamine O-acyltransferase n=1 Tax=Rosistilla ulvae TaxID=1930277 RepID=A0A517M817_9BACT|nr:acyl-ACP--UDP-N-acetylglucosamine O-acyltransferase [Rosistilla ulvae]QDS91020.1 Acyl-[acyl-carrier-protein]--UDP-N-acetylglucosamine O-acyltransferase [Rosistilla ulvae]
MSVTIAHTAVVDPRAQLGDDVRVGHFCLIGPHARIGTGTQIENHVTIMGHTTIGENNHIFPNVVIGGEPQDLSYQGSPTQVIIGDGNVIREGCTINRATEKEDGITSIGDHCYLMAYAHVAHDCRLNDRIVMANNCMLGGHVHIDHDAILSGGVAVHHYASVGAYCFISGLSRVKQDVPPYMLAEGSPARPRTVNVVGLKRNDFSNDEIRVITEAFKLYYRRSVGVAETRQRLLNSGPIQPSLLRLLDFLEHQTGGKNGRGRDRRKAA